MIATLAANDRQLMSTKNPPQTSMTHRSFASWRSKDALAASIQLRHDDVLCLVGTCLSREIDNGWSVHLFVKTVEKKILQHNVYIIINSNV